MRHIATALFIISNAVICLHSIADDKQITYCDHGSYPPISWVKNHQLQGVSNDIVTHILQEQGYQLKVFVLESWKRCMLEVELGNIDIAVAYITPERLEKLVFAEESLVSEEIAIFVNKNRSFAFKTWQDLAGKQVGMVLGYSYGAELDEFLNSNTQIERVSSNFQNITKLALQRIDFMPFEKKSGLLQIKSHGYEDSIIPLDTIATTDHLYLTTAKTNGKIIAMMPALSASIKQLKDNGRVVKFTQKSQAAYLKAFPPGSISQDAQTIEQPQPASQQDAAN